MHLPLNLGVDELSKSLFCPVDRFTVWLAQKYLLIPSHSLSKLTHDWLGCRLEDLDLLNGTLTKKAGLRTSHMLSSK